MFRLLILLFVFTLEPLAFGQFSFGVKGGVPLLDALDSQCQFNPPPSGPSGHCYSENTKRYTVGPMVELRFLPRFAIEVDALYSRIGYRGSVGIGSPIYPIGIGVTSSTAVVNSWELPLLVKRRFSFAGAKPFLEAGPSFHYVSGSSQVTEIMYPPGVAPSITTFTTDHPSELQNGFSAGFTMGGGIELRAGPLHISPELRYARWGSANIKEPAGALTSNLNQFGFLLGVGF